MAITTPLGTPVVGIKYTKTTDSSADWSGITGSTYFYDLTDKMVYYKNSAGAVSSPYNNTSGAVCGISDTNGIYTYYPNLTNALTAATSGQCVEIFADITESTNVTISLKDGVTIDGHGHTYTFSYTGSSYAFVISSTKNATIQNLNVVRSGGDYPTINASQSAGYKLYLNNTKFTSSAASTFILYNDGYGTTDGGIFVNTSNGIGIKVEYYGITINARVYNSGSGTGIQGAPYDGSLISHCYAVSNSGTGISAGKLCVNSTGVSTSGYGMIATEGRNCVGISTSGTGFFGAGTNNIGISTSGIGYYSNGGDSFNGNGISSSSYGFYEEYGAGLHVGMKGISTTNIAAYTNVSSGTSNRLEQCYFYSKWNNSGGHALKFGATYYPAVVNGCILRCTHSSANNINTGSSVSFKLLKNIYSGGAGVHSNITNSMLNTEDNYGNITE